ncbi:PAS domain-containing hybrid sensor histidine kinase/response regulator [Candidatus Methanoperedens nitratireducens]|uniref:PAS/PAC sensor hybrid histidine kinase (Modular protein) n=1 Tax=Candidatus Methanoperedens nitratireducens TaxID=1392998 RepID=A0A284VL85_9EURY|nr:PAS domain-containing sensor histidine kinase [Candidatus Methanoperedens nitroreducens]SNQ60025.1 PAS/PAC sensor hybrid histidine kinase (modular protein) [Candidatus Methanoperedens nitroreducens]
MIGQTVDLQKLSTEDVKSIIHELQVHHIELEMQNEELRRTQSELEESRNRYSNLYDFAPIGYFTFDKNGLIIEVNLTGANKLGMERSFLIKKPFSRYITFSSRDVFYQHLRKVFRTNTKQTCEIKLVDKNKNQFNVQLESLAVQDSGGNFSQCRTAIIDVTELKRAEEKLQRADDELVKSNEALQAETVERKRAEQAEQDARVYAESIVETLRESLVVLDVQLRVVIANQTFYRTFKVSLEETVNKFIYDLGNHQWDIPELRKLLEEVLPKNIKFHDFEVDHEFQNIGRRTMLLNARRIYQKDGDIELILLAIEDITEKKRLESQLLRSQRMESIGTLAGGIAHDLNNMLTPMMLSLQMLKEKYKDEQSQKLLTILEQNSQRSANLIKQVMSFARGMEGERKPLQVSHIISEIDKIAKETFPKNIELRTNVPDDLWTISGDVTQLHQVIMNLCVNARDAMPYGGVLSISAENFFVDKNFVRMHTDTKVGSYVVITVSDTGTGIPPKIVDRIFEPFFTTKEQGKGTGLGLSTALAIVKGHGGFINVYSEVGKGTAFRVYLPAIKTEIHEACEQQPGLLVGDGEWILVAEDEESIRDVTFSTLEMSGYKVLTANDGVEAVALYAQNRDKIKVILMDMMMPVMDGQASIRAIRRVNPQVKIIAVSGLTEKDRLAKVAELTNAFLPKPYTAERLLKTIHEVLRAK